MKQESLRGGEDLLETAPNGIAPSSLRDYELPNSIDLLADILFKTFTFLLLILVYNCSVIFIRAIISYPLSIKMLDAFFNA